VNTKYIGKSQTPGEELQRAMKLTAVPSDEELLRQMLAGDSDAFELLYDRRQSGIYQFALRMSGSPALAEDVTQDVFMALMRDGHQFDPGRGTVAGYLFGIARYRVLRRLQRERSCVSIEPGEAGEEGEELQELAAVDDPLGDFTRNETVEAVRQAVLSLPEHYREVVVLCSLHEMSYEQAAAVIDCPVGTVRSRLNRARAMLIEKLHSLQAGIDSNRLAQAGRKT
jgi:RNA polymerase sigma-70 factor, ECF subfamily